MDIVKFLTIEKYCDPVSQNFISHTALHNAVMGGNLEVVMFFIEELNCSPDTLGQWNMTPLQMALHNNHSDIAKYLQD